ncbi:MAG: caspase family protein [Brevirhabdus sp.]
MLIRFLASTAFALGLSGPALADYHALLIGASRYENLDERFWLRGPVNDMDLVSRYLLNDAPVEFSAQNVTVLADGIEGAKAPTLDAIRGEFARLAETVGPDDFVYLHFSGHGSQAPALDPSTELDGLDELFLPVDIGPWSDQVGTVENALVDDEIGAMIAALRAKGAHVWAVFDSCHSGTVTRAAPGTEGEVRLRKLPPEALGIAPDIVAGATSRGAASGDDPRARPQSPLDGGDGDGAFIAFYAAQTNETTPEMNMPPGKKGRRPQGVFTYTIFQVLAENPGITYGQLGQEVLRKYAVRNLARSTPMFEGNLDAPVFGAEGTGGVAQWPLNVDEDFLTIDAGALHGIAEGSVMAVMASPADPTEAALGYVSVDYVDTFVTETLPVEHEGQPAMSLGDVPKGAYLRRLTDDLDFGLTLALPEPGSAVGDAAIAAIDDMKAEGLIGPRIRTVPAGQDADLRLAVLPESPRPDAVWVLPASGIVEDDALSRTPSVSVGDKSADELAEVLADTLTRMSKTFALLRLGEAFSGADLDVDVALLTRNRRQRDLRPLDTNGVPRMIPGDEVHIEATNHMDQPVDVNVLYIGSDYSISHMFSGRMQPGDTLKKGLLRITDDAFGRDRVVLVITPAKPQSVVEHLGFLAQPELPASRGQGQGGGFGAALAEAGFGTTTRAAVMMEDSSGPGAGMLQFEIDTIPGR